ncbi:MAG: radical SAM protein [Anaerolineales bacterium]|jgi:SynChlorMet cassette radical SAM/SPASM protein ScmF|nr:radical SAM protein [Anaerolineales bacterium]
MNENKTELPEGVPPLTDLYIYAAGSCNLACRHCWITPEFIPNGVGGSFVKIEHAQRAIQQGKLLGLRSVKLTGGEPLLHPQIRQLVTIIEQAGLSLVIETNGTLIDKSLAQFLSEFKHGSFISVSIDGAIANTHDLLRAVKGSFEKAVSGIKNLVAVGYRPQIICTLHQGNISEMAEIIHLAEKLGCNSVKFNHVQKVGRGNTFGREHGIELKKLLSLFHYVETELVPNSSLRVFFDVPIAFWPLPKLLQDAGHRCSIGNIIGLLSNGDYALCGIGTSIPDLVYGNAGKDNLQGVWYSSDGLLRLRKQVPAQLEGICADCIHRDQCQGACIANNFHAKGKLTAPYFFCEVANQENLFPASRKRVSSSLV